MDKILPPSSDESDACEVLWDDPVRAAEFHDGLTRDAAGYWVCSFKRGEQTYVLREWRLLLLAIAFMHFDPRQVERQREADRKAQAEREAAERADQAKRDLLRRSVLGS